MAKGADVKVVWLGDAEKNLRHTSLNVQILKYVDELDHDILPRDRVGECLNQCVFFVEVAMGDRVDFTQSDYDIVIQRIKNASIINENMLKNIIDLLKLDHSQSDQILSAWAK